MEGNDNSADKKFLSLNNFLREKFGQKVIKISLDAGLTCPNRDGTLSSKGCIFCGGRGSGDFAFSGESITNQFNSYRGAIYKKWPKALYIPYFQAYTNTYGDVGLLKKLYYEALSLEGVCALSIATRPDCLGEDIMSLLREIAEKTYLFVELGFQTSNENTAILINRCYENHVFSEAVDKLKSIGANVVSHIILGLPGESEKDMLNSVKYVADKKVDGIKFHQLYVLENTELDKMYKNNVFRTLEFDEYVDLIVKCIEILPPETVIHRLTGDAPREKLVAPLYSIKKFHILNAIDKKFEQLNTFQAKKYE